ncbi:hypothetical protein E1286_29505 [Nonomuraea terrae]|uniref:YvlB/LiaX N-terminal domain-containing protein n=1 Tax=Nonomuraea terrae TaxID=2530383 RepID=A0A4R4YEJ8_9ACTN|nr:hypothetical protein [Nonomuraea terrae]TDD43103.1 hypothetical protein E1286_29505 [Nonomuraea terrae]
MNEQRRDILDMLAEGKITADEAERLITALERTQPPAGTPAVRPKYLRVVMEINDEGESGRLNVRIPLQLLRAGVQLVALVPPKALDRANVELDKAGVPLDLKQLKPEQLEALVEHLDEAIVEMDMEPDGHLRVFCE